MNNEEIKKLVAESNEFRYQMLSRLQDDVKYYLGAGNGDVKHLWGKDIRTHIEAMLALYDSFKDDEVPEWITYTQIMEYKWWMLNYHKQLTRPMKTTDFFKKIDDMLDYDRAKITAHFDRCRVHRITNDYFEVGFSVRSRVEPDGYKLFITLVGDYGEGATTENIGVYTIDEVTPDAIKALTDLGVDYMLRAEEYVRDFADDFQWSGYRILYKEPDDGNSAVLGWYEDPQRAEELAIDFRKKHKKWKGSIVMIDLENRKEVASY